MNVKEFLEKFDGTPYDDERLAEVAAEVEGTLGEMAINFLNALNDFEIALDDVGFERG